MLFISGAPPNTMVFVAIEMRLLVLDLRPSLLSSSRSYVLLSD